jgi:hypothetical protein
MLRLQSLCSNACEELKSILENEINIENGINAVNLALYSLRDTLKISQAQLLAQATMLESREEHSRKMNVKFNKIDTK